MNVILQKRGDIHTKEAMNLPCVTLVLPVNQDGAPDHIMQLEEHIETEIRSKYPKDIAEPVIIKLHKTIATVRHDSSKKSVVIFVSPAYEKIFHLDLALEEKIIIDWQLEIRDLVKSIYPADKYLLLVQSAGHFKLFLGSEQALIKININIPDNIEAYKNDIAEKVENFSDTADRKEVLLDKFVHHIDKELGGVLNHYKLPVFVLGTERMNGHFKKYTHHEKAVLDYIHGNYDDATEYQLLKTVKPYLSEIKNMEKKEVLHEIEQAQNENKFCFGIEVVWPHAVQRMGRLLLIENGYHYPDTRYEFTWGKHNKRQEHNGAFMEDGVDVIIEKVLENGGTVKFVEPDVLEGYQHIALCLYY